MRNLQSRWRRIYRTRLYLTAMTLLILTSNLSSNLHAACLAFPSTTAGDGPNSDKAEFIKNYLFLNLAFPQASEFIDLGLASEYLLNRDSWAQRKDLYKADIKKIWTAMQRAHLAHDVETKAKPSRVAEVVNDFVEAAEGYEPGIIKLLLLPARNVGDSIGLPDRMRERNLMSAFYSEPQYAEQRRRLRGYCETILTFLRSAEMRERSKRFREIASERRPNTGDSLAQLTQFMLSRLQAELELNHPELQRPFREVHSSARTGFSGSTLAQMLIKAFTEPGFLRQI